MPKPQLQGARRSTIPSAVVQRSQTEDVIVGDTVALHVGVSITLSASYQSIKLEAALDFSARKDNKDKAFERAWDMVNAEIARQLPDAKTTLRSLTQIREDIES